MDFQSIVVDVIIDDPKGFQFDLEKTFAFRYMNMAWFMFVCIEEKLEPIFVSNVGIQIARRR